MDSGKDEGIWGLATSQPSKFTMSQGKNGRTIHFSRETYRAHDHCTNTVTKREITEQDFRRVTTETPKKVIASFGSDLLFEKIVSTAIF